SGGAPRSLLIQTPSPWAIMVASAQSSEHASDDSSGAVTAWTRGDDHGDPIDRILQHPGGIGLRWAADDTLVFLSYRDGWPHLYSLRSPGRGGRPTLLTPGAFMVEHVAM